MRTFVNLLIGFVFMLIVVFIGMYGFMAFKAVEALSSQDWSDGIKPVLEKVWCGKPGCLSSGEK